ncbi:MAG: tetratricopeptide repeat protein [Phycisphaerae bacterium]|jgi:tetratricopeptide (TPR) repeat protein
MRDFGFPDADRPFGRPRYLDRPYRHRRSYLRPDSRLRRDYRYYYDDYTYRFGPGRYGYGYDDDLERAYRQGVSDGQNYERFDIQAERGLATYQGAMAEGHAQFEEGHYAAAARQFLLAATVNQGDPASRLCAAHAHFALGEFEPAVRLLHRAFELQPKFLYLPLDIRGAYGKPAGFDDHLRTLRKAAFTHEGDSGLWLLLGYCRFYSADLKGARVAIRHALDLAPDDELTRRLAALAGVATERSNRIDPPSKKSQRTAHDL